MRQEGAHWFAMPHPIPSPIPPVKPVIPPTLGVVNPDSPIGKKWSAMGGEPTFGAPMDNEHPAPAGTGTVQQFANGTLWAVTAGNVFYISKTVWEKYFRMDSAKDAFGTAVWKVLGVPEGDAFTTTEGGQAVFFAGGSVGVRPAGHPAWCIYGAIWGRYTQLGSLADPHRQPFMGFPTSDEEAAGGPANDPQRVVHFDGADLFWSSSTGVHEMHGAIRDHWNANSFLGIPITDETGTPDGIGRFNRFQNGMIYWTPATGAHAVHGAILDRWSNLGYEQSYLGYPVSDEQPSIFR